MDLHYTSESESHFLGLPRPLLKLKGQEENFNSFLFLL
jgi:hypothetical protein